MSKVINAIRKVNDRLEGLVNNLGADNPIVQDYISRMESSVPSNYIRYDDDGLPKIIRSKDFEQKGYTERDFDMERFKGMSGLRAEYKGQYEQAKAEAKAKGGDVPTRDEFIGSMGNLQGNIPLLYKNATKEGVQDAINTLHQSNNSYEDLMNVADVIEGLMGSENEVEFTDTGSHTIPFD